ncbi:ParA family protein [Roseomonas nepalensis]|uniref:Chromosome partitioning protein ParA n=1 Tax=Muricoccus nepalensis TaxID=1854500 RepID=A0A502G714_9PROT|nr:AAA family ATPase [Roseomonas nepalensis]TPG56906.1 ParA family protein [Roseomonas nepalensis]
MPGPDRPLTTRATPAGAKPGPRRIALANQKGGVGKTTTAINMATALSTTKRVLLLDLDPQGNASTGLGVPRNERGEGSYALLVGEKPLSELICPSKIPGLDLLPADNDLAGAEIELVGMEDRERRLARALDRDPATLARYDYILMDCPPSLGLLTLNALVAAQSVLVPLQTEFFALEGISQMTRTVERVKRLNPGLSLDGIVLTMFDRRNNLSELVARDVRSFFKDRVYDTVIPRNIRVSEAPSHGLPVLLYDVRSAGAQAYIQLAAELLRRDRARAKERAA